jgi:signal transduction histidine kinase
MLVAAEVDIDVDAVVRRVVDDFQTASPERSFVVRGQAHALARAKELWLEQILTNLVSNAVKYSADTESVEVCVSRRADRIQVGVADSGCGIPAHEVERVFERFYRVKSATTQTGTGLGLYIARQLAEDMDGTISVESVLGQGSRFLLDVPAAPRLVDVRSASEMIDLEAS